MKEAILLAGNIKGRKINKALAEKYGGLTAYLYWLSGAHPKAYSGLLGKVLPHAVNVRDEPPSKLMTPEEVRAEMIRRGIPAPKQLYPTPKVIDVTPLAAEEDQ
jgi:hypothetical protein